MAIIKMINSPRSQSLKGLHGVLSYCCREAKTNHEGQRLITGVNCVPQTALQEFMNTKRLHKQNSGRMFYHMVQSFPKDETITPETVHEIALKLAEAIPGFEIVVATHCDADHVHSHFVINSVSFETGKKYHSDSRSIQALWDASDKLCLQYGFSVIKKKQNKEHRMNDREYRAYERGNSWKMSLEIAIDDCMTLARSREHFMRLMEYRGYEVTWTDTRKNITYTTPQGYKCRDRKLNGKKYLKEEMEYEFKQRAEICRRYENGAETDLGTSGGGTKDRRRYGAELEGVDLFTETAGRNVGADFRTTQFANDKGRYIFSDAGANQYTGGASGKCAGGAGGFPKGNQECSEMCGDEDSSLGGRSREDLWASERRIFESYLRRENADEAVEQTQPVDYDDPQRSLGDIGTDTAFLLSPMFDIIDDEEPDDYYTRRQHALEQGMHL